MELTEMFTICEACVYAPCICGNEPENCVAYVQKNGGYSDAFDAFDDALQDTTTVDAVVVTRCKDCKYYNESRVLSPNKFCFRLSHPIEPGEIGYNVLIFRVSEDDFCSRGVRKDGGNAEW